MRFGSWWAVQFDRHRPFALGFHVEHRRLCGIRGMFGPYVDFHLPFLIVSIGFHPIFTLPGDLAKTYSRGGLSADA